MTTTPTIEVLREYYAGKQFEFGWASLCWMNLPDNLEGLKVLDIGCRRGKGVFKLSDRVGARGRAVGVDWCEDYIREAQERCTRAWQHTGLPENNMAFAVGYPEDLAAAGMADASVDVVYINSVINLTYDPAASLAECARVLKPGGLLVVEAVTANVPRDAQVLQQARAMGNSVQSAPLAADFAAWLAAAGLAVERTFEEHEVFADSGYKPDYQAPCVETAEQVTFTAGVFHARKPL
ncbi:MAG: class I SAM-dependent methyltransferase [Coriobacteriia bacterium]|nr:class I SAM-dependent methyltransferase [Coriobacteriia bacterium]